MKGRVLVVEDDPDVLELYRLLLPKKDFEVWGAVRTGEEAVELYLSAPDPPDAVLLDHRLPGCTGVEAARRILKACPAASFVLVTADESAFGDARRVGIRHSKRKPVTNAELLRSLSRAIAEGRREHHAE